MVWGVMPHSVRSTGVPHVPPKIAARYLQLAVVAPFIGVADFRRELGEFGLRALLGLRAHPIQGLDVAAIGVQHVADERFHARLVLGREVFRHVALAQRLAQRLVDEHDAALPARAILRNAAQYGSGEREALVDEGL